MHLKRGGNGNRVEKPRTLHRALNLNINDFVLSTDVTPEIIFIRYLQSIFIENT